jgi:hypothetical protein
MNPAGLCILTVLVMAAGLGNSRGAECDPSSQEFSNLINNPPNAAARAEASTLQGRIESGDPTLRAEIDHELYDAQLSYDQEVQEGKNDVAARSVMNWKISTYKAIISLLDCLRTRSNATLPQNIPSRQAGQTVGVVHTSAPGPASLHQQNEQGDNSSEQMKRMAEAQAVWEMASQQAYASIGKKSVEREVKPDTSLATNLWAQTRQQDKANLALTNSAQRATEIATTRTTAKTEDSPSCLAKAKFLRKTDNIIELSVATNQTTARRVVKWRYLVGEREDAHEVKLSPGEDQRTVSFALRDDKGTENDIISLGAVCAITN